MLTAEQEEESSPVLVAKVVGTVVATKKDELLTGKKLLMVSFLKNGEYSMEQVEVAVDSVGAGVGDVVLIVSGSSARKTETDEVKPIDMSIVGIIDEIQVGGMELFTKEAAFLCKK